MTNNQIELWKRHLDQSQQGLQRQRCQQHQQRPQGEVRVWIVR
jgi:hypothetical protein